jgi:hypothetical protein
MLILLKTVPRHYSTRGDAIRNRWVKDYVANRTDVQVVFVGTGTKSQLGKYTDILTSNCSGLLELSSFYYLLTEFRPFLLVKII